MKAWIAPFRASFPDVHIDVVELVAEGDTVVGRFTCSGTHEGEWRGHPPTGRRFERVDEIYFFRLRGGKITLSWGLEDTADRLRQLGLRRADPRLPRPFGHPGTYRSRVSMWRGASFRTVLCSRATINRLSVRT